MPSQSKQRTVVRLIAAALSAVLSTAAMAQSGQIFAYPNGGQGQQQQEQDRYQCHQWSVSQTGFDPAAMPSPQAAVPPPPGAYSDQQPQQQSGGTSILGIGGGLLGDAAKGAALGAAGGALTGDAGKGAAIGALASTALGALTRANQPAQQAAPPPQQQGYDYYQQNQAQAMQERQRKQGDYNAAFGACMKARNYTVN